MTRRVKGKTLKVGDRIKVWWSNDRQSTRNFALIKSFEKYTGNVFKANITRVANVEESSIGQIIHQNDYYDKLVL